MKYDYWASSNLGKGIDYDGVYGVQCVDLVKHYIKNVLEFTPQSIGNAIEYYNKRNTSSYLKSNFKWIDNYAEFIPQKGDICVFTSNSGMGHMSVATGEGTSSYFYSYDQNYPTGKHEPMTKTKHSYKSFLGVHRPYNQANIDKNEKYNVGDVVTLLVNLKVREGAGTNYNQKKTSDLSADGRKHAKDEEYAVLKEGTKVTIKDIKYDGNDVWIQIPSGWLAAYYDGKTYVE